ncbi:MAG: sugar transferase [Bacteroidota bacterium]
MPRKSKLVLKRVFDLLMASTLLVVLFPCLVLLALLVWADSGRPILFHQERVGLRCRKFYILKFRTMVQGAPDFGLGVFTEENDPRITRVGRFLRRWSLDELPQLINVLRGEMSLIGPRPTMPYQVARYDEYQRRRLLMPPGLTGWAQVNGRNSLTWPQRIQYDVWYVDHWSLQLDLRILLRTLGTIWSRQGVYGQPVDEISRLPGFPK